MTTPPIQYNESRPHPWVDPNLQGIGDNQRPAIECITVRNPIAKNGKVDWRQTALDLAQQLHITRNMAENAIDQYSELLEANTTLRRIRGEYYSDLRVLGNSLRHSWWFRLFASPGLKTFVHEISTRYLAG